MTQSQAILNSHDAIERHLRCEIEPEGFDTNGARFVLCDDDNRVLAHVHIGEIPDEVDADHCAQTVGLFAHHFGGQTGCAILLALTRPGVPAVTEADRLWYRVAHQVCAEHETRLLGVHIVTPHGQRPLVLDDVL